MYFIYDTTMRKFGMSGDDGHDKKNAKQTLNVINRSEVEEELYNLKLETALEAKKFVYIYLKHIYTKYPNRFPHLAEDLPDVPLDRLIDNDFDSDEAYFPLRIEVEEARKREKEKALQDAIEKSRKNMRVVRDNDTPDPDTPTPPDMD